MIVFPKPDPQVDKIIMLILWILGTAVFIRKFLQQRRSWMEDIVRNQGRVVRGKLISKKFDIIKARGEALYSQVKIWESLDEGRRGILKLTIHNWMEDYQRVCDEAAEFKRANDAN